MAFEHRDITVYSYVLSVAVFDELGVIDYPITNAGIAFTGSTVAETEIEKCMSIDCILLER